MSGISVQRVDWNEDDPANLQAWLRIRNAFWEKSLPPVREVSFAEFLTWKPDLNPRVTKVRWIAFDNGAALVAAEVHVWNHDEASAGGFIYADDDPRTSSALHAMWDEMREWLKERSIVQLRLQDWGIPGNARTRFYEASGFRRLIGGPIFGCGARGFVPRSEECSNDADKFPVVAIRNEDMHAAFSYEDYGIAASLGDAGAPSPIVSPADYPRHLEKAAEKARSMMLGSVWCLLVRNKHTDAPVASVRIVENRKSIWCVSTAFRCEDPRLGVAVAEALLEWMRKNRPEAEWLFPRILSESSRLKAALADLGFYDAHYFHSLAWNG